MTDPISNFFQQQLASDRQELFVFAPGSLSVKKSKKSLREIVVEFFLREEWEFIATENPSILRMTCRGESGQWHCYAKIDETKEQFAFYSVSPHRASPEKLLAVAEYTSRANYGMTIGNFELDFADGEIRYKTSIDFQNHQANFGSIAQLVYTNILMMDRYLPGIWQITEQNIEPNEAIQAIES